MYVLMKGPCFILQARSYGFIVIRQIGRAHRTSWPCRLQVAVNCTDGSREKQFVGGWFEFRENLKTKKLLVLCGCNEEAEATARILYFKCRLAAWILSCLITPSKVYKSITVYRIWLTNLNSSWQLRSITNNDDDGMQCSIPYLRARTAHIYILQTV